MIPQATPAQEPTDFAMVDDAASWAAALGALRAAPELAFDLEADGFHRYPERVCLLQLAVPDGRVWIVDPLAIGRPEGFGELLAEPGRPKVLHSGSYDVRALYREFGFTVAGLRDSSIAAQLLGHERTGLGAVLQTSLGLELAKSKRLQRMDWSRRPLPDDALAYAADDVAYLLPLEAKMRAELTALGRLSWYEEECRRLEQARPEPEISAEQAALQVKGARELSDRGRAVLLALWRFREAEAIRTGRPPYRVLGAEGLVRLAAEPASPIDSLPGIGRALLGPRRSALLGALAEGKRGEPLPWPARRPGPMWTPLSRERLVRLKAWREREAAALGLGPGLIWSARHLDQLALHPAREPEQADLGMAHGDLPWVRAWQWSLLGDSLRRELAGLPTVETGGGRPHGRSRARTVGPPPS